jgi:predicted RNA-binding Zn ribbon-like protein
MVTKSAPGRQACVLSEAPEVLCIAFVNSVAWRKAEKPADRLPSPLALLDWCRDRGLCDADYAAELRRRWAARPREARAIHRRAITLREAIYRILRSRIRSEALPDNHLQTLNRMLAAAPRRVCLVPKGSGFGWSAGGRRTAPTDLLAPIAWSAADLLMGPRAQRVRQCADEKGCGWLFIDESRAGTRRWCSMGECGNRAKARRHYLRRKKA